MKNRATATGLYTDKQIDYVNSVRDEDLRGHLLHQVRLRDNMEQDRDVFEKQLFAKNTVEHAMKILKNTLKTDEDYRRSWKANIAMAFKDEYSMNKLKYKNRQDIHKIANDSADNFLKLLCS